MTIKYSEEVSEKLRTARPGDVIGHRRDGRPIRLIGGGSESDIGVEDDNDDEDEDQDEDGQDDDKDEDDDAPSAEEFKRLKRAHAKAKSEAKKYREKVRELEASSSKDASDKAVKQARQDGEAAAETKYKKTVVKQAARAELIAAGAKPDRVDRLIRLIDMDEVEVDEDGDVLGLEDEIKSLKADYSELFGKRSSRGQDGADKKETAKPKTSAAKLVAGLRR